MAHLANEIKHLYSVSFDRYIQKLSLSGYDVPDPYSLDRSEWVDDISKWPSVDYGCIYQYFINTPGMYTTESMKAYKSLDSYALYHAGHVQTVLYHGVSP